MCIVLFDWQPETRHSLVVAANRDEFHQRPAEAARWRNGILCGLDVSAGGTWLGVTQDGRFAVVTNYREPLVDRSRGERSRGLLPMAFLEGIESPERFAKRIATEQDAYGAFNLVVGDGRSLWYLGNRGAPPQAVAPGIHGLSNGLLDEPWPKVERGKVLFAAALAERVDEECLLALLQDRWRPDDARLPSTGLDMDTERMLAPIFIGSPTYGTRSSTAVILRPDEAPVFVEQRWQPDGTAAARSARRD